MELPYGPAMALLGIYPKNHEIPIQKNLCTPVVIAVLFTIAKCWKQPKCPSVDGWIKKLVHLLHGILCSRKKEGTPASCDSMDGTGEYAKWNKPAGERIYHMISHIGESNEQSKLMNKIGPWAWKHGTDWQWPEGRREGDNGGKKGKGLVKEHVWMTHGHGQQCGDWLWE